MELINKHTEIKAEITNIILVLFAFFCIPLISISVLRMSITGWMWNYNALIIIGAFALLLTVFRNKISSRVKTFCLICIFMAIYLEAAIVYGIRSNAGTVVVFLTSLTLLLTDLKKSLFVFVLSIVQYFVINVCHYLGILKTDFDMVAYDNSLANMLTNFSLIVTLCVIIFIVQYHLFKRFSELIRQKNSVNNELTEINRKLKEEIDKRKTAEQSLTESELRFRRMAENAPVAMFRLRLRPKAGFDYVNKKMMEIFNYSADDFYGSNIFESDFVNNLDRENAHALIFNRECWGVPKTLRFSVGSKVLWTEIIIVPVENEAGEIIYLEGILQDITSRFNTQLDLIESEVRYKTIFNGMTNGLVMFDETGKIVDVNNVFLEMKQCSADEIVHGTFTDLLPVDYKVVTDNLIETVTKGESYIAEVRMSAGRDNWIDVEIRGAQIKLKGHKYYLAIMRNLTEQKQMQMQLLQKDKMASLGVLVSGVAHEINNPNNYIKLNAKILEQAWNDAIPVLNEYAQCNGDFTIANVPYSASRDQIRNFAKGISDGSERIKSIVNSLKDFARKDTGEMNHSVELWNVLESAMTILDNMIKNKAAFVNIHCETGSILVRGNYQQLEQVLINLLSNALQALETKDRGVFITLEKVDDAFARIKIKDEGEGMTRSQLEKIYDPFYTTKRESGGTGLGLSITYTIIKNHNGNIEYKSEVGKGTTVSVKLPLFVEMVKIQGSSDDVAVSDED